MTSGATDGVPQAAPIKVAVFSAKDYDRDSFTSAAQKDFPADTFDLHFLDNPMNDDNVKLAYGYPVVCIFVNDTLTATAIRELHANGLRFIALRCAGFNNVDLQAAEELAIPVARVPAYSPYAVAEHAAALMLMLNRHLHRAYNRTRDENFSIQGLMGFDVHGSTVGVVGTGQIGACFARIMKGFGATILGFDVYRNETLVKETGLRYVDDLKNLLSQCDVVSLHCPLLPPTHHLINEETVAAMKRGAVLINTSRGGLIKTSAAIDGLKTGQIGSLGIDVYENEADVGFFEDHSGSVLQDDQLGLLRSYPNVVITAHQAFFTKTAVDTIANTTLTNIATVTAGGSTNNLVQAPRAKV